MVITKKNKKSPLAILCLYFQIGDTKYPSSLTKAYKVGLQCFKNEFNFIMAQTIYKSIRLIWLIKGSPLCQSILVKPSTPNLV